MKYEACPKGIETKDQKSEDWMVNVRQSGFLLFLPVLEAPLVLWFEITNS
jgi:hypothetical protein